MGPAGCSTTNDPTIYAPPAGMTNVDLPPLVIGETVKINITGPPTELPPSEKVINGDGTITLPDIGTIQAAGLTSGDLEKEIHSRYVPAIYTHADVTVEASSDRVYFVRGEVKNPGRSLYTGPITVTKAITSAGDFTDFANRKRVYLTRGDHRYKLNCDKILGGGAPDPPVFPGDQIEVKRRLY